MNLYLEDTAAVKNVDIASGKDSKWWLVISIQMHGKKKKTHTHKKKCLFISLVKAENLCPDWEGEGF